MPKQKPIPSVSVTQEGAVTTIHSEKPLKLLFMSDIHIDSYNCHREQFFKDLAYARTIGALVVIVGDFFDAMQGRFDPRRDMSAVRPEYRVESYYDAIVDDAISKLKPWRRSLLMVTPGNHELSVLKNANTDIMSRFIKGISTPTHHVLTGGYGGVINLIANNMKFPIKYFHGAGGEAPVTKGAIQTNRQAAALANFTLVLNGHNHNAYYIPIVRETMSGDDHDFVIQHHVRTPGYMMAWGDGTTGWEVTRGGVPKPIGSFLVEFGASEERPILILPLITKPIPVSLKYKDIYDGPVYPQE